MLHRSTKTCPVERDINREISAHCSRVLLKSEVIVPANRDTYAITVNTVSDRYMISQEDPLPYHTGIKSLNKLFIPDHMLSLDRQCHLHCKC